MATSLPPPQRYSEDMTRGRNTDSEGRRREPHPKDACCAILVPLSDSDQGSGTPAGCSGDIATAQEDMLSASCPKPCACCKTRSTKSFDTPTTLPLILLPP